jgi:nucleoside-diphosphate-sugar epimerase
MRVLVAGATGVIGSMLAPMLAGVGHDVMGLARSRRRAAALAESGAELVVADALDRAALIRPVQTAEPDAMVHLLTALPARVNPRRLSRDLVVTNRLRTEGTRNLLDAAEEAGVGRVVAQGLAILYQPGEGLADEDEPMWTRGAPRQFTEMLRALAELERMIWEAGGLVLRFGHLTGPGSAFAAGGSFVRGVRHGKLPVVGEGNAVFSFIHAVDAAAAVVAALDRREVTGALNVVDDTPAPVHEWLPGLAGLLHAPVPGRVPAPLGRLLAGRSGVAYMNELRGADNRRARLRLDWRPRYGSWAEAFATGLEEEPTGTA